MGILVEKWSKSGKNVEILIEKYKMKSEKWPKKLLIKAYKHKS